MTRCRQRGCRSLGALIPAVATILLLTGATSARPENGPNAEWPGQIRSVDDALTKKQYSVALRAANSGYAAALGAQRWDGLVAAGDAYHRIGEATGLRQSFATKAREAYLRALFQARRQASVEGVLRVTEGFASLGDTEAVAQGLRIAERLAARDPDAQADVRALAARLADLTSGTPRVQQ